MRRYQWLQAVTPHSASTVCFGKIAPVFSHCLKLILLFVIYRFESDIRLHFDLQRRDFDVAGYFAGKNISVVGSKVSGLTYKSRAKWKML